MITSNDIVNEAIQIIGNNQPYVTGTFPNFDTSPSGKAAAKTYQSVCSSVMRQTEWDFLRSTAILNARTSGTIPAPWRCEYDYPVDQFGNPVPQIWQILPYNVPTDDINMNPISYNWVVGYSSDSPPAKVIWTNLRNAQVVYTRNPVGFETYWDALFRQAVVRMLASELAMAVSARPDTSRDAYETGGQFIQAGANRDS